jgi:hypothetical protein
MEDYSSIFSYVSYAEHKFTELKLHSARTLPNQQNVNAFLVNPQAPVDIKSTPRAPSSERSRTPSNASRPQPPSNGARPKTSPADNQPPRRQQSQSPRRGQQQQRGRSPGRAPTSSSAYTADMELDDDIECLQYYSRYSTSPNAVRKQSVPGIFRRALTPKSKLHLKESYFYSTSGEQKFADVRTKGNCLRCYGSDHRASACKVYTMPTPTPCRACMHLYHPTGMCKFYDASGGSRPPSTTRSASKGK